MGFCGVCGYYDDDTLLLGMRWLLAHSCEPHRMKLRHLRHLPATQRAEESILALWKPPRMHVDAYTRLQWEHARRWQLQYAIDQ